MKGKTIIIILIVAIVALMFIVKFNNLVTLREAVNSAWTPLVAQLNQRYDEIPKLVNETILYTTTEDAATHALASAQKEFTAATSMTDKAKTANIVEKTLEEYMLQAGQRYPGISGHYQFIELRQGFDKTKQQMEGPTNTYNKAIEKYNTYAKKFPNDIVALLFGFGSDKIYFMKEQD